MRDDPMFDYTTINSNNTFATATSAGGPWTTFPAGVAPWSPRASAALTSSSDGRSAILASGMTFVAGVPSLPTQSDVWQIDAGVCLLAPINNQVCAGAGTPNLDTVSCSCNSTSLDASKNCGVCAPNYWNWAPAGCATCPTGTGGTCNSNPGGVPSGTCDPVQGCVCATGWANGGANPCNQCAPGFFGPTCSSPFTLITTGSFADFLNVADPADGLRVSSPPPHPPTPALPALPTICSPLF